MCMHISVLSVLCSSIYMDPESRRQIIFRLCHIDDICCYIAMIINAFLVKHCKVLTALVNCVQLDVIDVGTSVWPWLSDLYFGIRGRLVGTWHAFTNGALIFAINHNRQKQNWAKTKV